MPRQYTHPRAHARVASDWTPNDQALQQHAIRCAQAPVLQHPLKDFDFKFSRGVCSIQQSWSSQGCGQPVPSAFCGCREQYSLCKRVNHGHPAFISGPFGKAEGTDLYSDIITVHVLSPRIVDSWADGTVSYVHSSGARAGKRVKCKAPSTIIKTVKSNSPVTADWSIAG